MTPSLAVANKNFVKVLLLLFRQHVSFSKPPAIDLQRVLDPSTKDRNGVRVSV